MFPQETPNIEWIKAPPQKWKKKKILAGKDCQIGNDNFLPLFKEHQPNLN